ncbi:MAG: hypothetical protein C5S45_01490 [Candidatus Methanocomedens sp.]|nr:MAG: hypothetical protein C5S45_01490 [ANME-2 cluster archaeon]
MVIPSYWARESKDGVRAGDAVYDHPTPLDEDGTLLRALQSLDVLEDKDFQVVVIAAATAGDIEDRVEDKVAGIIDEASWTVDVDIKLFASSHLGEIYDLLQSRGIDEYVPLLQSRGMDEYVPLLQLWGYSNIRNLCLFIPHILGSDLAVLIDDDEVFEDTQFIRKVKEFMGSVLGDRTVHAVAGYYLQSDGDNSTRKKRSPWMEYWGQYKVMDEGFDRIIRTEPRLKETPFVFGGNMVIHRELFTVVPFDPGVPRGEDIDYLINARMFGFSFFLDNKLSIRHLPPSKSHPMWMQLREDIYRFIYERAKLEGQVVKEGMVRVAPEDLDPYPGRFLRSDLEEKVEGACRLLSEEYLEQGDTAGSEEALQNIELARTDAVPVSNPFEDLCELQKRWKGLMEVAAKEGVRSGLREIIEGEKG